MSGMQQRLPGWDDRDGWRDDRDNHWDNERDNDWDKAGPVSQEVREYCDDWDAMVERTPETGSVTIDCDDCAVRGAGCQDCVVSVLLGVPEKLLDDERRALEVLAEAGLAPRLRLVPIHRKGEPGVA